MTAVAAEPGLSVTRVSPVPRGPGGCAFLVGQDAAGRRTDPGSRPALKPHGREGAKGGAQRCAGVPGGGWCGLCRERVTRPPGPPGARGAPALRSESGCGSTRVRSRAVTLRGRQLLFAGSRARLPSLGEASGRSLRCRWFPVAGWSLLPSRWRERPRERAVSLRLPGRSRTARRLGFEVAPSGVRGEGGRKGASARRERGSKVPARWLCPTLTLSGPPQRPMPRL